MPISTGETLGTLASAWHSSPKSIISLLALLMHHSREVSVAASVVLGSVTVAACVVGP